MAIKDRKMHYQIMIENIRFTKQQIWNTVYYALLANGGLIALIFGINKSKIVFSYTSRWIFTGISISIFVIGGILLFKHHWSLTKYRLIKDAIDEDKSDYLNSEKKREEIDKEIWDNFCKEDFLPFTFLFSLVIFVVAILAEWVIWKIDC